MRLISTDVKYMDAEGEYAGISIHGQFPELDELKEKCLSASDEENQQVMRDRYEETCYQTIVRLVQKNDFDTLINFFKHYIELPRVRKLLETKSTALLEHAFKASPPSLKVALLLHNPHMNLVSDKHMPPILLAARYGVGAFIHYMMKALKTAAADDHDAVSQQLRSWTYQGMHFMHAICSAFYMDDPAHQLSVSDAIAFLTFGKDYGLDINADSPQGSPLVCALLAGKGALVNALIDLGANVENLDCHQNHAFHFVRDEVAFLSLMDEVPHLIDKPNKLGQTPLHMMLSLTNISKTQKRSLVALFCEFGAVPHSVCPQGNAFAIAAEQKDKKELTFILNATRYHLVLMRQISVLPQHFQQAPIIAVFRENRTKATRHQYNKENPVDYLPMPSIYAEQVNVEIIKCVIRERLTFLLQAILSLHCKAAVFEAAEPIANWLPTAVAEIYYAALRENVPRNREGQKIVVLVKKYLLHDGIAENELLKLAQLAIIDNHQPLTELTISWVENNGIKRTFVDKVDPIALALKNKNANLAECIKDMGYLVTSEHIILVARMKSVDCDTLSRWITWVNKAQPLKDVEIVVDAMFPFAKQRVLRDAGCRILQSRTTQRPAHQLANYGTMSAPTSIADAQSHTSREFGDVPLLSR